MAGKVILCIDDEPATIDLVRLILMRDGFEVRGANSGREAMEHLLRHETPDLILLDVMMPDMDGWAVLEQLRAHKATRQIPVVLFTAKSLIHLAKVDGYIRKPFTPKQLLREVRQVLGD